MFIYLFDTLTSFDRRYKNGLGLNLGMGLVIYLLDLDYTRMEMDWTMQYGPRFIMQIFGKSIQGPKMQIFKTSRVKSANLQNNIPGTFLAKSEKMED